MRLVVPPLTEVLWGLGALFVLVVLAALVIAACIGAFRLLTRPRATPCREHTPTATEDPQP